MPSTYTTNNGIEKIGIGEQAETWGNTTNDNLDYIDDALDGITTLTLSTAIYELNMLNGNPCDARSRILVLGGSPLASVTIEVGPTDIERFWMVHNNSGQTVTFSQGAGGGDVARLVDGESAFVYVDGTGVDANAKKFRSQSGAFETTTVRTENQLDNTDDLNSVTSPGFYTWVSTGVPSNVPNDLNGDPVDDGMLTVEVDADGNVHQVITSGAPTGGGLFIRQYTTSWSAWERSLLNVDVTSTPTDGATGNPISADWAYDLLNTSATFAGSTTFTGAVTFSSAPTFATNATFGDIFIDGSEGIYFENLKHAITWNDGTGNFNIRVANTDQGSVEYFTESGYAAHLEFSQSDGHWGMNISSASGTVGGAVSWRENFLVTPDAAILRYRGSTRVTPTSTGTSFAGGITASGSVSCAGLTSSGSISCAGLTSSANVTVNGQTTTTRLSAGLAGNPVVIGDTTFTSVHAASGSLSVMGTHGLYFGGTYPSYSILPCQRQTGAPDATILPTLGSSLYKFWTIYISQSPVVGSDRNLKKSIENSDLGLSFINALQPVKYRLKSEDDGAPFHYGLIAQDVADVITGDLPSFCTKHEAGIDDITGNEKEETWTLCYEELISPLIKAVQELTARVQELEAK